MQLNRERRVDGEAQITYGEVKLFFCVRRVEQLRRTQLIAALRETTHKS